MRSAYCALRVPAGPRWLNPGYDRSKRARCPHSQGHERTPPRDRRVELGVIDFSRGRPFACKTRQTNFGMYSMKIAVLPGDDIGPEITDATLAVLEAADRRFDLDLGFDVVEVGMAAHRRTGTTLPPAVMAAARAAEGIIPGPCGVSPYPPESDGG